MQNDLNLPLPKAIRIRGAEGAAYANALTKEEKEDEDGKVEEEHMIVDEAASSNEAKLAWYVEMLNCTFMFRSLANYLLINNYNRYIISCLVIFQAYPSSLENPYQ